MERQAWINEMLENIRIVVGTKTPTIRLMPYEHCRNEILAVDFYESADCTGKSFALTVFLAKNHEHPCYSPMSADCDSTEIQGLTVHETFQVISDLWQGLGNQLPVHLSLKEI